MNYLNYFLKRMRVLMLWLDKIPPALSLKTLMKSYTDHLPKNGFALLCLDHFHDRYLNHFDMIPSSLSRMHALLSSNENYNTSRPYFRVYCNTNWTRFARIDLCKCHYRSEGEIKQLIFISKITIFSVTMFLLILNLVTEAITMLNMQLTTVSHFETSPVNFNFSIKNNSCDASRLKTHGRFNVNVWRTKIIHVRELETNHLLYVEMCR